MATQVIDIALLTGLVKDLRGSETFAPAQVDLFNIRHTDAGNMVKRNGYAQWRDTTSDSSVISLIPENDGYAITRDGSIYTLDSSITNIYSSSNWANLPTWTKYKGKIIVAYGGHPVTIDDSNVSLLCGNPPYGKFIATISSLTILSGIDGLNTRFYWSTVNNPELWDSGDFASIQDTGTILNMKAYKDRLLFFKEDETEVWNFVGGSDPFVRYPGGDIYQGLGARDSVVQVKDRMFWFGNEGDFYVYDGSTAQALSGSMRRKLDTMNNPDDLIGFNLRKENCIMWTNIPDGITVLYDYKRNKWLEDKHSIDNVLGAIPFSSYMEFNRKQCFGNNYNTGMVYEWSEDYKDDDGTNIIVFRGFKARLSNGDNRVRLDKLVLRREGSMATASATDPKMQVRYRWDSGTWSIWRQETIGKVGKHDPYSVELRSLGMGKEFEIEVRQSSTTDFVMTNAVATFTEMMG